MYYCYTFPMGVARRAAIWRNSQQNQEMNMGAYYLCFFLAGFISWGVAWLFIPVLVIMDICMRPRVSRRTTPVPRHRVHYR